MRREIVDIAGTFWTRIAIGTDLGLAASRSCSVRAAVWG